MLLRLETLQHVEQRMIQRTAEHVYRSERSVTTHIAFWLLTPLFSSAPHTRVHVVAYKLQHMFWCQYLGCHVLEDINENAAP